TICRTAALWPSTGSVSCARRSIRERWSSEAATKQAGSDGRRRGRERRATRVPVAARPALGGDSRARTRRPAVAERHLLVGVRLLRARRGRGAFSATRRSPVPWGAKQLRPHLWAVESRRRSRGQAI